MLSLIFCIWAQILIETPKGVQIPILGGASPKRGCTFYPRGCISPRGCTLERSLIIIEISTDMFCIIPIIPIGFLPLKSVSGRCQRTGR